MAPSTGLLRYHQGNSLLHRMDALSKGLWVLMMSIGLYLVAPPHFGAIAFACLLLTAAWLAKMPLTTFVRSAPLVFLLGGLLLVFHSVVQPGQPLFRLGPLTMSDCGLAVGLHSELDEPHGVILVLCSLGHDVIFPRPSPMYNQGTQPNGNDPTHGGSFLVVARN